MGKVFVNGLTKPPKPATSEKEFFRWFYDSFGEIARLDDDRIAISIWNRTTRAGEAYGFQVVMYEIKPRSKEDRTSYFFYTNGQHDGMTWESAQAGIERGFDSFQESHLIQEPIKQDDLDLSHMEDTTGEHETCPRCDRRTDSPNFAYHVCTGRKTKPNPAGTGA